MTTVAKMCIKFNSIVFPVFLAVPQTGLRRRGLKDLSSNIRIGPRRAVAGGGTSKSGGGIGKAIHFMLSCPPVSHKSSNGW